MREKEKNTYQARKRKVVFEGEALD